MFVPLDIKQRVTQILEMGIAKAEQAYGIKLVMPAVTYLIKGTCGGTADYRKWVLDFNSTLLMENIEAFLSRTVLHELGHLVCDRVYPDAHRPQITQNAYGRVVRKKREVHGPRWQSVMVVLGGPTARCHSYDVSSVSAKRVTWNCIKCTKAYNLGPKHQKMFSINPTVGKCKCGGFLKQSDHNQPAVRKVVPVYVAPVQTITPVRKAAPAPVQIKVISANQVKTISGSKIDMCAELYANFVAKGCVIDRKVIINLFMTHAQCTPAGAATYYATLKKRYATA